MKKFILIAIIFTFSFANSGEKVFIENNSGIYNIKIDEIPKNYKKHYEKRKHKSDHKKSHHYVASKKGKVFHKQNCKFAKRIKKKIYFKTKREAINKGLRPCRRCRP